MWREGGIAASRLVCCADPETIVAHHSKNLQFVLGRNVLCVFERDVWFKRLLDFDQDGRLLEIYCEVALQHVSEPGRVSWIDLDLDVALTPGSDAFIAGEDEFEANALRYGYPTKIVEQARSTASLLLDRYQRGDYPFKWRTLDAALADLGIHPDVSDSLYPH
jgi:protein associated with RNAse G/E